MACPTHTATYISQKPLYLKTNCPERPVLPSSSMLPLQVNHPTLLPTLPYGCDEKTRRPWLLKRNKISRYQVRTRYQVLTSCLHPMSIHCQSSEDKISSSAPLLHLMSSHCLFDWGQDILFCPSPPPYANSLPLWLRTRYPVLPTPPPYVNPLPLWLRTRYQVLPSPPPYVNPLPLRLRITSSTPSSTIQYVNLCLLKWGQDIHFCPPSSTLWQSTASQVSLHRLMSIHCLFDWGQDNQFSPFLHHTCSM